MLLVLGGVQQKKSPAAKIPDPCFRCEFASKIPKINDETMETQRV